MSFWRGNMKDVKSNGFSVLEPGRYLFEIQEVAKVTTRSGDPMAKITLVSVNEQKKVWDNIVFPLPGSAAGPILGRSKHFLHAIGEPYEDDDLAVDPDRWLAKKVVCKVGVETYTDKEGKQKEKNVVMEYILQEETADEPAL